MKKHILCTLLFCILLTAIWCRLQYVFEWKYEKIEHLQSKYKDFFVDCEETGIDVLFLGTSPTLRGISPNVIWNETGITSYNLASAYHSSPIQYYSLVSVLKQYKPKVVVVEVSDLTSNKDLDSDKGGFENAYRSLIKAVPQADVKKQIIDFVCEQYQSQTKLTYYLSLLKYHSRWNELTKEDFNEKYIQETYNDYLKGTLFYITKQEYNWDNFIVENTKEPVSLYIEYYEKIIELCKQENITIALNIMPKVSNNTINIEIAQKLSEKHNVELICYSDQQELDNIGLDPENDFYDIGHMNIYGNRKYSVAIAHKLKDMFNLPNHKQDANYSSWNEDYYKYLETYSSITEKDE